MKHEIDGSKVIELKTNSDLKKLEIKRLGHRLAIVKSVKHICKAQELIERLRIRFEDSDFISSEFEFSNSESKSTTKSLFRHRLRRSLKCEVDQPTSDSICSSRDEVICGNTMLQWEVDIPKSSNMRGVRRHLSISRDCDSFKSECDLYRDCAKVKSNFTSDTLG